MSDISAPTQVELARTCGMCLTVISVGERSVCSDCWRNRTSALEAQVKELTTSLEYHAQRAQREYQRRAKLESEQEHIVARNKQLQSELAALYEQSAETLTALRAEKAQLQFEIDIIRRQGI
jgi:protein-arginine kinase activator protein McsA